MQQETPKTFSNSNDVKKCKLHGIIYIETCPLCEEYNGGKKMVKLEFLDMKTKKMFTTDKFTVVNIGKRKAAKAISPSGTKAFRFLPKDFKK